VCLEHFNGRYYLAIRYEGTLLRYHFDQKSPEGKGAEVPEPRMVPGFLPEKRGSS